jgi:hypothetical protein
MQVGSEYSYIQFAASKSTFSWISQLKQIIKRASDSFSQNFSSIFFRGGGAGEVDDRAFYCTQHVQ